MYQHGSNGVTRACVTCPALVGLPVPGAVLVAVDGGQPCLRQALPLVPVVLHPLQQGTETLVDPREGLGKRALLPALASDPRLCPSLYNCPRIALID